MKKKYANNEKRNGQERFGDDVEFISKYAKTLVLTAPDSPGVVAIAPGMQARVMTSSADGDDGLSFGWINRRLIRSGNRRKHINPFGGEDRFWLGPEGGQFSIFFKKGAPFDLAHWQTPEPIDWGGWDLAGKTQSSALFRKRMSLINTSGTCFDLLAERKIQVLRRTTMAKILGVGIPGNVKAVGFASDNKITNEGTADWRKSTGLLSIWILGMFKPSPTTTIVIPSKTGPAAKRGSLVNDAYFGKVPGDRLKISRGVIFFKGDGLHRSKIGVAPGRAKDVAGSYDSATGTLTIVKFDLPRGSADYVNSMWEFQDAPYSGDAVNSYNDGPPEPGKAPLGPFYELETSSPALALRRGASARHVHQTFHFQGEEKWLDIVARSLLGAGLRVIKRAL